MNLPQPSNAADYVGLVLATGTYVFLCWLIYVEYQSTGELNQWMLGSLLLMLLLSLGTLFGFGRLEQVFEKLPVNFGSNK
jgi:hypothetical protein